ncbi:RNA-directed DNA polymerase, eukaryota, reverse transcriptase zinc-binding domain protein, partial [Tanacetum coccineum]
RNLNAVKTITKNFGKILEVGRLDFDPKVLSSIKSLVLTTRMNSICQSVDVMVNGKVYPVKVSEEQFHVSSFLRPSSSNKFDEGSTCFEEEYIGPTLDEQADDGGDSGEEELNIQKDRSPRMHNLGKLNKLPKTVVPKAHVRSDSGVSLSSHANFGDSPEGHVEFDNRYNFYPCTSGLPPPPSYNMDPPHSPLGVDIIGPTPDPITLEPMNSSPPTSEENVAPEDINSPQVQPPTCVQEDNELEELMSSFQKLSNSLEKTICLLRVASEGLSKRKRRSCLEKGFVLKILVLKMWDWMFRESKLEDVDHFLIRSLWPRSHVDWAFSSSIGASGGIITMWDSRVFMLDQKISNRNFLGLIGTQRGQTSKIGLLNVYSPQSSSLKEQLWLSIRRARTGLCDLPLGWRRFTRFDKEGRKASKLDRFLVSSNFFNVWNGASVSVLCRSVSDHYPIKLKLGLPNFGPKPFKFFDKWISAIGFQDLVVSSWASNDATYASSNPDIVLKNKLKKLRLDIKAWSFGRINEQNKARDDLKKHLLEWDIKAEEGLITDYERAKREEWLMDLDYLDRIHREDLNQKCRIKWAIEGDENTRFFHSILKINYCNSNIKGIMVNGIWQEDPDEIKKAAYEHFSSRVIASVISPNQAAFISGRQILDGILVANEIIRMDSVEDTKLLIFKVDFEKTFDSQL